MRISLVLFKKKQLVFKVNLAKGPVAQQVLTSIGLENETREIFSKGRIGFKARQKQMLQKSKEQANVVADIKTCVHSKDLQALPDNRYSTFNLYCDERLKTKGVKVLDLEKIPETSYPEVVFLGRSNSGKTSLIKHVLGPSKNPFKGPDRVKLLVSKHAGATHNINLYKVSRMLRVADTPGYGFGSNIGQGELVKQYLRTRRQLRLAVICLDARRGVQDSDKKIMELLTSLGIPFQLVITKLDLLVSKVVMRKLPDSMEGMTSAQKSLFAGLYKRYFNEGEYPSIPIEEEEAINKLLVDGFSFVKSLDSICAVQEVLGTSTRAPLLGRGLTELRWAMHRACGLIERFGDGKKLAPEIIQDSAITLD